MPTSVELANALVSAAGSGDAADAALVAARLAVFPEAVLGRLQRSRTKVRACRNSVVDHLTRLQGERPRGWPPGSTWDSVPGVFYPDTNEVVIAIKGHEPGEEPHVPSTGEGEGSVDLVVHETAHGLDMGGGTRFLSASPAFIAARNADLGQLTQYELQSSPAGEQETFAESAARFYGLTDGAMPALHSYWSNIASQLGGRAPTRGGLFHFAHAPSIGSASVASDGTTIRMHLRAIGEDGAIGDGLVVVQKGDAMHRQTMDHVLNIDALRSAAPSFDMAARGIDVEAAGRVSRDGGPVDSRLRNVSIPVRAWPE